MPYIFFDKENKEFFWSEDPALLRDNNFTHLMTVQKDEAICEHKCKQSVLQKEDKDYNPNYTDEIQRENELPKNYIYLVIYYEAIDEDTVITKVDIDITKKDIIKNVQNQKYREGAIYYKLREKYRTKQYKVDLPNIVLPENILPATVKAYSPAEARTIALRIASQNLTKLHIRIRLNGYTTVTEWINDENTKPKTASYPENRVIGYCP